MRRSVPAGTLALALFCGCPTEPEGGLDLADDPVAYIESMEYRRGILERDLTELDNRYAQRRLDRYATVDGPWDTLDLWDPPSAPLSRADTGPAEEAPLEMGPGTTLTPETLPSDEAGWIDLGRRVFFEYPLRADRTYEVLATLEDGLDSSGFIEDDGAWVGLRKFRDADGSIRVGPTCSQCHASRDEAGVVTGVLANRAMDVGRARLLTLGYEPGALPPEIESTAVGDLDRLGPGRSDLLADGVFNPYAFPDFGGLGDMPYLHQNANWFHRGVATLAVRCETLFITARAEARRPPRALAWALAVYLRSLPAPPPLEEAGPAAARGEAVFEEAGCADCHAPPLFTSDREVAVDEIGTDPGAGSSPVRWTGNYRVPSLRGVGRTAPYLHHGAFDSLEAMFDPDREEPGHVYGSELDEARRADLIAFLRSI